MVSVAWLIGWALILEYTIGGSSVARGISPNLVMLSIKFSLQISELFIIRPFFQALFFGGQDKLPFFLAQVHVRGLDTPVDPCAAILVLIVTALLCLGIKEVLAQSPHLVSEILFAFIINKKNYPLTWRYNIMDSMMLKISLW